MGVHAAADLVVITRKAATLDTTQGLAIRLRRLGAREVALVDLRLGDLRDAVHGDTASLPFHALEGQKVLAIAGVGNPGAFFAQLGAAGANVNPLPGPIITPIPRRTWPTSWGVSLPWSTSSVR